MKKLTNLNDVERFNGADVLKVMEMIKKPSTNFDRIIANPEALATFIHEAESVYERCAKGDLNCNYCECQWCGLAGRKELIDWLNEESEE